MSAVSWFADDNIIAIIPQYKFQLPSPGSVFGKGLYLKLYREIDKSVEILFINTEPCTVIIKIAKYY